MNAEHISSSSSESNPLYGEHINGSPALRLPFLHVSERRLLLEVVDTLLINVALFMALRLRPELSGQHASSAHQVWWFGSLSILWLACAFLCGCYNLRRAARFRDAFSSVSIAVLVTCFIYLLTPYATPVLPNSRITIAIFPLLALGGLGAWRLLYSRIFVRPRFEQCALVVGAGWAGSTLARMVQEMESGTKNPDSPPPYPIGYRLMGFVDDDPAKNLARVEGVPVLGTRHELVAIARRLRPHELVVAITHMQTMHAELFDAILECREMGIAITPMAELYEQMTGRVPVEHAGRTLGVAMPLRQSGLHRLYRILQRGFDIVAGAVGCIGLLLVMPAIWLANRVSAPGPLFYEQERVGRGGQLFRIVKFRSMVQDAEKYSGAVWAEENDPRITPLGRFLRKTRLDEVPQFWNVLKGDMSMIGPRPERPHFTDQLAREIPFYRARHAVKPGLTGWAQVRYRYGASVEDALIKLQYDLFYIKHQSALLDVEILFRTIPIVLGFKGR